MLLLNNSCDPLALELHHPNIALPRRAREDQPLLVDDKFPESENDSMCWASLVTGCASASGDHVPPLQHFFESNVNVRVVSAQKYLR